MTFTDGYDAPEDPNWSSDPEEREEEVAETIQSLVEKGLVEEVELTDGERGYIITNLGNAFAEEAQRGVQKSHG